MALLDTFRKGESITIAVTLPESYDTDRIQDLEIAVGSKVYQHTLVDHLITVKLSSIDTAKLSGYQAITIMLDDSSFGVRKIEAGTINISSTYSRYSSDSEADINNIIITLTITETAITVSSVLYNLYKGDKGDTGEQGEQGITGDPMDWDETITLKSDEIDWQGTWIKISGDPVKQILFPRMRMITGSGDKLLNPVIHYPSKLTYNGDRYQGFLIRDAYGRLNPDTDFDSVIIQYNIGTAQVNQFDTLFNQTGENVIVDENSGETFHSDAAVKTFNAVYPDFAGSVIESIKDPLTNYAHVSSDYQSAYMGKKEANLLTRPYGNGAVGENDGGNSNILATGAHYSNTFERHDITAGADIFLQFAIAVGARPDNITDTFGTSYGYGMEFFEPCSNVQMNADYPDWTAKRGIGTAATLVGAVLSCTPSVPFNNILELEVGSKIWVGSSETVGQERIVQSIDSDSQITVTQAFTLAAGSYGVWLSEAHIGSFWNRRKYEDYPTNTQPSSNVYYQSPACSVVAAKFRKIRDLTGASWAICREAARATASKAGVWDMYRGFGIIDVDAAVEYIEDNYMSADFRRYLNDELPEISPLLDEASIGDNKPTPMRVTRGKADTIHDHAGQSINPDNVVIDKQYTDAQAANLSVGTIFYNVEQLCWMLKTSTNTYLNMGEELPMICKNGDSATHLEGQAVYVSSGTGKLPVLKLTNSTIGKCSALTTQDVPNTGNARGYYCFFGQVRTFPYSNVIKSTDDADNWVEGAKLYLCNENGKYSTVKEDAPAKSMEVATITDRSGANISVMFNPIPIHALTDLSDVDGTAATIAEDDQMLIRTVDDGLVKEITKANFYNSFQPAQYRDEYPSGNWVQASGAAMPDSVAYTIGGIGVIALSFDGVNTEERMTNNFEIPHDIDIDAVNAGTLKMEIHIHSMASTNDAGTCKWFIDMAYLKPDAAPIALTTKEIDVPVLANQQYFHKIVGVEITEIPAGGYGIGGIILFTVRRTPTATGDDYTHDMIFKQCALHVPVNSIGSRQRYIK